MRHNSEKLLDVLFAIQTFSAIVTSSSIVGKLSLFFFVLLALCMPVVNKRKVKLPPYILMSFLFVLYVYLQIKLGIAEVSSTKDMCQTVLYMALFQLGMFNYIVYRGDMQAIAETYAKGSIAGLLMLMIVFHESLFAHRLSAGTSVMIGGLPFSGGSATGIAMCCVIPAFFISIFPPSGKVRKAIPYVLFFFAISLATGTRKTLLPFAFILFFILEWQRTNLKHYSIIKNAVKMAIGVIIVCVLVMNVPVLYDIIGHRLEDSLTYFQGKDEGDASIVTRDYLKETATFLFYQRPIFGWGMDYFKGSDQSGTDLYSHSNFLELLSGGGIVGFFIYYANYVLLFVSLLVCYFKQTGRKQRLTIISCVGFLLIMVALEYWQVSYYYRRIMIYQVMLLGMLYLPSNK